MSTEKEDDFEFDIEGDPEIEVVDDTPEADKGREPMPKNLVEELEADELEEYSDKVKTRLKQMKKVWHDERREKEREQREKTEALSVAQRYQDEVRRLRETLSKGEETLVTSVKDNADLALDAARRQYREAHEAGDTEKLIEASERLAAATNRAEAIKNYKPALQVQETEVPVRQDTANVPRPDPKSTAWQERNTWFGSDAEMTAAALGLHRKLLETKGAAYASSDDYWKDIDTTMRRRFPEYFGDDEPQKKTQTRAATVVAPASRSTSSKKIVLTKTQVAIAKRLGVTPEAYAREQMKLESA